LRISQKYYYETVGFTSHPALRITYCNASSCGDLYIYQRRLPCYTGLNDGLDTLVQLNGFYRQREIRNMQGVYRYNDSGKLVEMGMDTSYSHFMFFDDGMFISGFSYYHDRADSMAAYLTRQALHNRPIAFSTGSHGVYTVHGDTIKVRYIYQGGMWLWGGGETWYRIVNRTTLVKFYSKLLHVSREDRNKEQYQPEFSEAEPAYFIPLPDKPKSLSWLKDEAWFMCTGKKAATWRRKKQY